MFFYTNIWQDKFSRFEWFKMKMNDWLFPQILADFIGLLLNSSCWWAASISLVRIFQVGLIFSLTIGCPGLLVFIAYVIFCIVFGTTRIAKIIFYVSIQTLYTFNPIISCSSLRFHHMFYRALILLCGVAE